MRTRAIFIIACVLAAIAPVAARLIDEGDYKKQTSAIAFSGWETHFENRPLKMLPLTQREQKFNEDFPGRTARFTDGEREIIFRFVTEATRKLHPAADCFQAIGFDVRPLPLRVDAKGVRWGSFTATRGAEKFKVSERIYDEAGNGWTDASSWYWAAQSGTTRPAWRAVTIAERPVE